MERLEEPVRSGVVVLDAGIVHDIAMALNGTWTPDSEPDDTRRAQMLAAARLRIYADRDQFGWYLGATAEAREAAMGYDGAEWSVGFIQDVATMEGAPPIDDVAALETIFKEAGIVGASAAALANAMLFERAAYVITSDPNDLKHQRSHDLPPRLEILDPVEAVSWLQLVAGEEPIVGPPVGSALDLGPHWWLP